jgi:hypothetical protein
MSLDPCRPLSPLSLSLTSLLSRPVSIQGSGVGSPEPHSHLRVGRGFNGGGLSRREGRFSLYIFVRRSLQEGGTLLVFGDPSKMRAGGGTERAASFGWRAPCLGQTHLGCSARRASPGLPQGPSAGSLPRTHSFVARDFWTHSFERRLPWIRKDQRGPVRRPQIPAPKPAESHGGARRTGGLSAWTILSH